MGGTPEPSGRGRASCTPAGGITRRQRVARAIRGELVDRVPKGELLIDDGFVRKLLDVRREINLADRQAAIDLLGLDLVTLPLPISSNEPQAHQALESIVWWAGETDLFVFALLEGPFSRVAGEWGLVRLLKGFIEERNSVVASLREAAWSSLPSIQAAAQSGADAVIVGDDIAYQKGTYVSPHDFHQLYFPSLKIQVEACQKFGLPLFFHSDGNIMGVIDGLVAAGIDGLQGLEPVVGVDIGAVRRRHPSLCLMGNVDLAWLSTPREPEEISDLVAALFKAVDPRTRFIFGTSGGLMADLPIGNVVELYRAATTLSAWKMT